MSTTQHDLQQVIARYAHALDSHDHDALGDLHAHQAQWTFGFGGQIALGPFVGRDAILEFVAASEGSGNQERHILTNTVVTHESGSTAAAIAYLSLVAVREGRPTISSTSLARFAFAASRDRWVITDLHVEFDSPPV